LCDSQKLETKMDTKVLELEFKLNEIIETIKVSNNLFKSE